MEFKLKDFKIDVTVTRMANVHYFEFTKEYHTFKDKHPFRELIYIDSGNIEVESDSYSGTLGSKQLLIHKNGEVHSLSCVGDSTPNVIIIGFECDCERLDLFSERVYTLSNELIRNLTEVVKEGRSVFLPPYDVANIRDMKKRKDPPFGADQMLKLKLELFLIELIRIIELGSVTNKATQSDIKLEEIFTYINNNYRERITLDDLCFLFGTNKTTICKSFKNAYGDTVINYINKLRIENAKKALREGNTTLTQLSANLGFSSIHYFSKLFKSYENKSPSEYIASINKTK